MLYETSSIKKLHVIIGLRTILIFLFPKAYSISQLLLWLFVYIKIHNNTNWDNIFKRYLIEEEIFIVNKQGSEEEISLLNDYDFEQLDNIQQSSYEQFEGLEEIKKGSVTLTVLWYRGAVVGEPEDPPQYNTPKRISREIKAANAIWRTRNGERAINFTGVALK